MAESDASATCPNGHSEGRRVISAFLSLAPSRGAVAAPVGGGCGGHCACH